MIGLGANLAMIAMSVFLAVDGRQDRTASLPGTRDEAVSRLAEEVRASGRIVYCARSEQGDWDLFTCRPDGTAVRTITRTPEFNEAAPQMSRDGRRLLYRRLPRGETFSGNQYGAQGELGPGRPRGGMPLDQGGRVRGRR